MLSVSINVTRTRAVPRDTARERPHVEHLARHAGCCPRLIMKHMLVLVVAALGIAPADAHAQPPGQVEPYVAPVAEPPPSADEKHGGTAVAISVMSTLGSFALVQANPGLGLAGFVLGPSFGRWYNHEIGGIGLLARVTSVYLVFKGVGQMDTGGCEAWYTDAECAAVEDTQREGERMFYIGLGLWGAATLYDFIEAGRGSARYNRKLRIAPTVMPTGRGQATGIALTGQF